MNFSGKVLIGALICLIQIDEHFSAEVLYLEIGKPPAKRFDEGRRCAILFCVPKSAMGRKRSLASFPG